MHCKNCHYSLAGLVLFIAAILTGCNASYTWQLSWQGTASNLLGSERADEDKYAMSGLSSWEILEDSSERVAVAIQGSSVLGISLVIAIQRQAGESEWQATTSGGRLEAWLHRDYQPDRQTCSFDQLETFWGKSAEDRFRDPNAVKLMGAVTIRFRAADQPLHISEGNQIQRLQLDLMSVEAIPLYREWFESAPEGSVPWLTTRMEKPDQFRATIRGVFTGYWYNTRSKLSGA